MGHHKPEIWKSLENSSTMHIRDLGSLCAPSTTGISQRIGHCVRCFLANGPIYV